MNTPQYDDYPHSRSPYSPWLLVAITGIVIGAATVPAAVITDSRDFVARHAPVHGQQAL